MVYYILINGICSVLVTYLLVRWAEGERRDRTDAQVRFLSALQERNETTLSLTEALIRHEGKPITLTKPRTVQVQKPGWLEKKGPEEFVK